MPGRGKVGVEGAQKEARHDYRGALLFFGSSGISGESHLDKMTLIASPVPSVSSNRDQMAAEG